MAIDKTLVTAIKATAEIYGRQISDMAAAMFLNDLARFTPDQIQEALTRCRMELKYFPTVADIVARIDDGRPGPDEAWAMIPKDETQSVVWTDEMSAAFGIARMLIDEGDMIAARMTFKEIYTKLLAESRSRGVRAKWTASLGFEKHGRDAALREAVTKGRMSIEQALDINPMLEAPGQSQRLLEKGIDLSNLLPEMPK